MNEELLNQRVEQLALRDVTAGDLANLIGAPVRGEDASIRHLRILGAARIPEGTLGFALTADYLRSFAERGVRAAITTESVAREADGVMDTLIIHPAPADAFFDLHTALDRAGLYRVLEDHRGEGVQVAPSATIHTGVILESGTRVHDGAVLYPNTVLEEGATVRAGAIIGDDGFQIQNIGDKRTLVPHLGGVWLGPGSDIGSSTTVNRGLFTEMTVIGEATMLDSLVFIAHNVFTGARCTIIANAEVSGYVVMDDDVWYAPGAVCNQELQFGRGAFVGTGAVVIKDVPPFTLVRGNPARPAGHICICKTKLSFEDSNSITCTGCHRTFHMEDGTVALVGE